MGMPGLMVSTLSTKYPTVETQDINGTTYQQIKSLVGPCSIWQPNELQEDELGYKNERIIDPPEEENTEQNARIRRDAVMVRRRVKTVVKSARKVVTETAAPIESNEFTYGSNERMPDIVCEEEVSYKPVELDKGWSLKPTELL